MLLNYYSCIIRIVISPGYIWDLFTMGHKTMRGCSCNLGRSEPFKALNRIFMEEIDTVTGDIRNARAVPAGGFAGLISSARMPVTRSKVLYVQ